MALQNRVSPDGQLHDVAARGMFTGNRGVIHDPITKTLLGRRWSTNAWICCSLEWKGRKREVWGRNNRNKSSENTAGWSEVFFLDEVTALAAGHRPCHSCRNNDAMRFHEAYCEGNGAANAQTKNRQLHTERWHSAKTAPRPLNRKTLTQLPNGAMIKAEDQFYAIKEGALLPWGFSGYGKPVSLSSLGESTSYCVTPIAIIETLRHGYEPVWHLSAS